jgi:hypothetical protein
MVTMDLDDARKAVEGVEVEEVGKGADVAMGIFL